MKRSTTNNAPKKLALGKERVRELTHDALEHARGGAVIIAGGTGIDDMNETARCVTTAA